MGESAEDEPRTVTYGEGVETHGRIAAVFPASKARCPSCGARLFRFTTGALSGDVLATCPAKTTTRQGRRANCSQKVFVQGDGHGWVAVVAVTDDEWPELVDLETGEVDRQTIRRLGLHRAAHAALATIEDEVA